MDNLNITRVIIVLSIAVLLYIGLPLLTGVLAKRKNRSFVGWFSISFVISAFMSVVLPGLLVGILMVYILPKLEEKSTLKEKVKILINKGEKLVRPLFYGTFLFVICAVVLILVVKFVKPPLSNLLPYHVVTGASLNLFIVILIFQAVILIMKKFSTNLDFYILLTILILWIFTMISGSIWANQAWGRYWAWDPRETWRLITLGALLQSCIVNATGRVIEKTRRGCAVSLSFNAIAFSFIVISMYLLNSLLPGLHTYPKG